jgi:hypothetical protein
MNMTIGQRVTLLKIDDLLAMCHRFELEVRSVVNPPQPIGHEPGKMRVATVRQRGKRNDFFLALESDDILLDGWDQPFLADTEGNGVFEGNACYNFVGDADAIRTAIETTAVVPVSDAAKAKIIIWAVQATTCDASGGKLLYPDIETHHAVINRMKGRG